MHNVRVSGALNAHLKNVNKILNNSKNQNRIFQNIAQQCGPINGDGSFSRRILHILNQDMAAALSVHFQVLTLKDIRRDDEMIRLILMRTDFTEPNVNADCRIIFPRA